MKKQLCAAALAGALVNGVTAGAASQIPTWLDPNADAVTAPNPPANIIPTAGLPSGTPGTVTTNTGEVYPTYWLGFSSEEATHYLVQQDPDLASAEWLRYDEIEGMVRSSNRTVLANRETLASIEAVDLEKAIDDMKKAIDGMEDAIAAMKELQNGVSMSLQTVNPTIENGAATMTIGMATVVLLQSNIAQMEGQLKQMKDQLEELKKTDYEPYERQFAYIENQLVMAAQASYIGLMTIQQNYLSTVQQADLANVQYTEMQTRFQLGQVSALQLGDVKVAKAQSDSAIKTLAQTLRDAKGDFSVIVGRDPALSFMLDTLPQVTPDMLARMYLNDDLSRGEAASYDIYTAEKAVRDAEDLDRKADGRKEKIRAAEFQLENAQQTFRQNFHKLFRSVSEKNRLLTVAQNALVQQTRTTESAKLQYDQGKISRNRYIEATANQGKAETAVLLAQIDLYSAYMQYQWACEGVMTTASGGM